MPRQKKQTTKADEQALKQRVIAKIPDARPKLKKRLVVDEKEQTDGKDWEAPKARPKSLAALWGYKGDNYGTDSEEEYKKKLSKMNKADLQHACIKVGLMPHDSRQIMTERLFKQFRQHVAARVT